MIKILIVEDEPPIARALERCINQIDSSGVQVVGKSIHGQDALEILAKEEINVVITDIRMPVMDGLELLGVIHSSFPDIIPVVLSGYEDFNYARAALRYDVFDYLLKPISPEEVKKLLRKLEPIFLNRINRQKQAELTQAIRGKALNRKETFDCTAMLICAGPFPTVTDDFLLPGAIFWEEMKLEDVFQSLFGKQEGYFIFDGKTVAEKYIILENETATHILRLAQRLFDRLTSQSDINITMVSHPDLVPFAEIGEMIRSLRSCLYNEVQICTSKLIWYEGENKEYKRKMKFQSGICQDIVEYICLQQEQKLLAAILQILSPEDISQIEFMQMMEAVMADSRLMRENYYKLLPEAKIGLNDAVSNSTSIQSLCGSVTSVLLALGQRERQRGKRETQSMVEEIEQYLLANYSKSISSEILSKKFGLVPSYLSKVFRTAKGMSPSEYLIRCRMEKALQIIREQPNIRICDVAKITGYEDQYYFSKIFKKQTGMWPSEFQKSCNET